MIRETGGLYVTKKTYYFVNTMYIYGRKTYGPTGPNMSDEDRSQIFELNINSTAKRAHVYFIFKLLHLYHVLYSSNWLANCAICDYTSNTHYYTVR